MKPQGYRHGCIVSTPMPYHVSDGATKGRQPGDGVLEVGRVLWLPVALSQCMPGCKVRAYVEQVGVIEVDPAQLANIH